MDSAYSIHGQLLNFGAFISAIIYFIVFMAVVYLAIVIPYRAYAAHRGVSVFGDPAPVKTCPQCLSDDVPAAATRCKYCTAESGTASA